MTRPDHTAVPPAGVIAAAELKPCPFCGGTATPMHTDDCYFNMQQKLKDAPKGDLSLVPEVLAAWNRRAEGAAPTAAQAAGRSVAASARRFSYYEAEWTDGHGEEQHSGWLKEDPDGEYVLLAEVQADSQFRPLVGPEGNCGWTAASAASHAPHATLAPQASPESATSGATSAAKVELEGAVELRAWMVRRAADGHVFGVYAVQKDAEDVGKRWGADVLELLGRGLKSE